MGKINIEAGVKGIIGLQVMNKEKTHCRWESEFQNLIVDAGLDNLMGSTGSSTLIDRVANVCGLGTGTDAPAVSNTDLSNRVGSLISDISGSPDFGVSGQSPWVHSLTFTFEINTAGANGIDGVPLSEIGFFNTTGTSRSMWSRSLIKDMLGDPTTITLLPEEVLVVTYTIERTHNENDVTGTFTIDGELYDYTMRAANLNSSYRYGSGYEAYPNRCFLMEDLVFVDVANDPNRSGSSSISFSPEPYVTGSFERKLSGFAGINGSNFSTGINGAVLRNSWTTTHQVTFGKRSDGSGIMKTDQYTLELSEFFSFKMARS